MNKVVTQKESHTRGSAFTVVCRDRHAQLTDPAVTKTGNRRIEALQNPA